MKPEKNSLKETENHLRQLVLCDIEGAVGSIASKNTTVGKFQEELPKPGQKPNFLIPWLAHHQWNLLCKVRELVMLNCSDPYLEESVSWTHVLVGRMSETLRMLTMTLPMPALPNGRRTSYIGAPAGSIPDASPRLTSYSSMVDRQDGPTSSDIYLHRSS